MLHSRDFVRRTATVFSLATASLAAQTPDHYAVVGTISVPFLPVPQSGTTGVYLVPLPTSTNQAPQPARLITGLPPGLRVSTRDFGGAGAVLIRPEDGKIVVGEFATNAPAHVHAFDLIGDAVRPGIVSFQVAQVALGSGAGVIDAAQLPDGRFVLCTGLPRYYVAGSGPASVSPLCILDVDGASPGVTPFPLRGAGFTDPAYNISLSQDGRTGYVWTQPTQPGGAWRLFEVDVDESSPDIGTVTQLLSWNLGEISMAEMRRDGVLRCVSQDPQAVRSETLEIDTTVRPVTVQSRPTTPQKAALYGPDVDPTSGRAVLTSLALAGSAFGNDVLISSPTDPQHLTVLASEPTGGWGFPYGAAILPAAQRYGSETPGAHGYSFSLSPNPGGLPELGNAAFSLTVDSSGGPPNVGWMLIGAGATRLEVVGLQILAQPALTLAMSNRGTAMELPLPIPNEPRLLGTTLYTQAVLIDTSGWASSDALRVTVIR